MWMELRGILLQIKPHKPMAYFVYSKVCVAQSWSKRPADTPQTLFEVVRNKKYRIANPSRCNAIPGISFMHLFLRRY